MPKPDLKSIEARNTPSPEEIKAILQTDKTARENRAKTRIDQVLTEERCAMVPIMILVSGSVTARIEVKAQD